MSGFTTTALPDIRFYTALDPYNWTVDNRPLADLKASDGVLANSVDSEVAAQKILGLAAAYALKGYLTENMMVGSVSFPSGLQFQVDEAIMSIQAEAAPPGDTNLVPFILIQDRPQNWNTLVAGTTGNSSTYLISASITTTVVDTTTSYFDATLPYVADFTNIGKISWTLTAGTNQPIGGPFTYPAAPAGSIAMFYLQIPHGTTTLTSTNVVYGNFIDEGLPESWKLPPLTGYSLVSTGTTYGAFTWEQLIPNAGATGQVLTATGTSIGDYDWEQVLPTPSGTGLVLTSTGSSVGNYGWSSPASVYLQGGVTVYPISTTQYQVAPFGHGLIVAGGTTFNTPSTTVTPTLAAGTLYFIFAWNDGGSLSIVTLASNPGTLDVGLSTTGDIVRYTTLVADPNYLLLGAFYTAPAGSIQSLGSIGGTNTGYGSTYIWDSVPLTGGSGTGAYAQVSVNSSGHINSVMLQQPGKNYVITDVLGFDNTNMAGSGTGAVISIASLYPTGYIQETPALFRSVFNEHPFSWSHGNGNLPTAYASHTTTWNIPVVLLPYDTIQVRLSTSIQNGSIDHSSGVRSVISSLLGIIDPIAIAGGSNGPGGWAGFGAGAMATSSGVNPGKCWLDIFEYAGVIGQWAFPGGTTGQTTVGGTIIPAKTLVRP